eukprot:4863393-Prymnesium_polylepis.2
MHLSPPSSGAHTCRRIGGTSGGPTGARPNPVGRALDLGLPQSWRADGPRASSNAGCRTWTVPARACENAQVTCHVSHA